MHLRSIGLLYRVTHATQKLKTTQELAAMSHVQAMT